MNDFAAQARVLMNALLDGYMYASRTDQQQRADQAFDDTLAALLALHQTELERAEAEARIDELKLLTAAANNTIKPNCCAVHHLAVERLSTLRKQAKP